jgi:hypothetical protein
MPLAIASARGAHGLRESQRRGAWKAATWVRLWLKRQRLCVCRNVSRLLTANGSVCGAGQLLEEGAGEEDEPGDWDKHRRK